jgi:tetratricopeptide (TPR) repeat protein
VSEKMTKRKSPETVVDQQTLSKKSNIKGENAWEKGQYNDAIEHFSSAILLDPASPTSYLNRGFARQNSPHSNPEKDLPLALNDMNSAAKLAPNDAEIYHHRALAHIDYAEVFPAKNKIHYIKAIIDAKRTEDEAFLTTILNSTPKALHSDPKVTQASAVSAAR